jgi:hypothetical protein
MTRQIVILRKPERSEATPVILRKPERSDRRPRDRYPSRQFNGLDEKRSEMHDLHSQFLGQCVRDEAAMTVDGVGLEA